MKQTTIRPKFEDKEIQFLKYFEQFKSINMYYVEMKCIIAKNMRKKGFTLEEIGMVLQCHYASVIHYCKHHRGNREVNVFVSRNYESWIESGKYPTSKRYTKNGIRFCDFISIND